MPMSSSKAFVKQVFSGNATQWAAQYRDVELRTLEAQNLLSRQRLALDLVGARVPPPAKVLDVGCGSGETAAKLMRLGYSAWGVDIAEPMIETARTRWGAEWFQVADIERLPFDDNTFDAIVCLGVIEYQHEDEPTLRELRRVLKPGGLAIISTPSAVSPLYHLDRAVTRIQVPLHDLVKYRLKGLPRPRQKELVAIRRYRRKAWLRSLRAAGLEPEEWICHGWGWYRSRFGDVARHVSRNARRVRRGLESFVGEEPFSSLSGRFVRSTALNWIASEQLVRVRAQK
jgi:ubiquinone/menaquinone biosynthesis C-methylase UbiE